MVIFSPTQERKRQLCLVEERTIKSGKRDAHKRARPASGINLVSDILIVAEIDERLGRLIALDRSLERIVTSKRRQSVEIFRQIVDVAFLSSELLIAALFDDAATIEGDDVISVLQAVGGMSDEENRCATSETVVGRI